MKQNEQEKQFEVILSPTDILANEMEEILGGAVCKTVNACWENNQDCDINVCKSNITPCPEGQYMNEYGVCVPEPF